MNRIAFIVGHTESSKGALLYTGQYEYELNTIVACLVQKNFTYDSLRTFWKDRLSFVEEVKDFNPDLIIELHINAFELRANGCEALVLSTSLESKYEAKDLLKEFNKRFNIVSRGEKTLTHNTERGYHNIKDFELWPMVLFEPCFGNFKTSDSKKIVGNPEAYANFLVDYCRFKLNIQPKVTQNIIDKMTGLIQSWFN